MKKTVFSVVGVVFIVFFLFASVHTVLNNYASNVEERIELLESSLSERVSENAKLVGNLQKSVNKDVETIYSSLRNIQRQEQSFLSSMNLHDEDKEYIRTLLDTKRILYIMDVSNSKLTRKEKKFYVEYILKFSKKYDLSPVLVASQIHRESNFRPRLVSEANAKGSMQVIYKFHKDRLKKEGILEKDLLTIEGGVHAGCLVLSDYIKKNGGDVHTALMWYVGYNASRLDYAEDIFKMSERAYAAIF